MDITIENKVHFIFETPEVRSSDAYDASCTCLTILRENERQLQGTGEAAV